MLSTLELERRVSGLQKELRKEVQEKEALHREVQSLEQLKSLPSEVEKLREEASTPVAREGQTEAATRGSGLEAGAGVP